MEGGIAGCLRESREASPIFPSSPISPLTNRLSASAPSLTQQLLQQRPQLRNRDRFVEVHHLGDAQCPKLFRRETAHEDQDRVRAALVTPASQLVAAETGHDQ